MAHPESLSPTLSQEWGVNVLVLPSREFKAFAAEGGFIVLSTETILSCFRHTSDRTAAMTALAFAIAHEFGHLCLQHVVRQELAPGLDSRSAISQK